MHASLQICDFVPSIHVLVGIWIEFWAILILPFCGSLNRRFWSFGWDFDRKRAFGRHFGLFLASLLTIVFEFWPYSCVCFKPGTLLQLSWLVCILIYTFIRVVCGIDKSFRVRCDQERGSSLDGGQEAGEVGGRGW